MAPIALLGFSDAQLQRIKTAAEPLPPEKRSTFLNRLMAYLQLRGVYRHPRDDDVEVAVQAALRGLVHQPAA